MLVLARKVNDRIKIGDDIELVVTSIQGGIVRLGIDAPKSVTIDRAEVPRKRGAPIPPPLTSQSGFACFSYTI